MRTPWTTFFAIALCACNGGAKDDTEDTDGEEPADDTVTLSGNVLNTSGDPIAGAEVCFDEPADIDCITTDEDGFGSVELPKNTLLKVRITATGFPTVLTHGNTEEYDIEGAQVRLISDAEADAAVAVLGLQRDATKGNVLFVAATDVTLQTKVSGVTVTSTATTGTQAYATEAGIPDAALTATSAAGTGTFVNVDPGDYEITFDTTEVTCVDGYGWPSDTQPATGVTMDLPVEAGIVTFVSAYCN